MEHLTTISIVIRSFWMLMLSTWEALFLVLICVPAHDCVRLLSKIARPIQRLSRYFEDLAKQIPSPKRRQTPSKSKRRHFIESAFINPAKSEIIFRFIFDKVWHSLAGSRLGLETVPATRSSVYLWANSIFYGLATGGGALEHIKLAKDDKQKFLCIVFWVEESTIFSTGLFCFQPGTGGTRPLCLNWGSHSIAFHTQ